MTQPDQPDLDQLLIDMGAASYALSILYELRQAITKAKITGDMSEVHRVLAEHRVPSTGGPAGPTGTDSDGPLVIAWRYSTGLIDREHLLNSLAAVDYTVKNDDAGRLGYNDLPDPGNWSEVIEAHRAGYLTDDDYSELVARVFGSPVDSEALQVSSGASAALLSRGDTEAQDWATEFLAINAVHAIASDWEALVTWFSNAIKVGRGDRPQYRAFGGPRRPRLHITNDDADRLGASTPASRSLIHLLEAGGPRTLCCAVAIRELPRDAVLTYAEERTTCRCTVAGCQLFADQHADRDHSFSNVPT